MQIKLYEDDEGVRRKEIEKLGGNNQFSNFYERLKEIRDYHRRNPTNDVTQTPDDEAAVNIQVQSFSITWIDARGLSHR